VPAAPPKAILFGALAIAVAGADLLEKALDSTGPLDFHPRSLTWAVGSTLLIAAALLLSRLSPAVAAAGGVMAGGMLGNLLSALAFSGRVPNPIVIGAERGVAFNLADVFTIVGICALGVSISAVSIRHRHRLLPPRAWERAVCRRLGL
jgi:hypothetical protein